MSFFIAGLISPEVLQKAKNNMNAGNTAAETIEQIKKCDVLEIRYDLFFSASNTGNVAGEWETLAENIHAINPKATLLGTIRLKQDGGKWADEKTDSRADFFKKILSKKISVNWIDLERGFDSSFLQDLPKNKMPKIIRSQHFFERLPSEAELAAFAEECLLSKSNGCKIAAMPSAKEDVKTLYDFAKNYGNKFEWFSAFGMGEIGRESRIRSLKEGANLTYCCIGNPLAPGQINVNEMRIALGIA